MWVRSRTRRRRRSGTRRRRRRRRGWLRSGRSGGRACPGRRSSDNVACAAATTSTAARSAGFTPVGGEPDRAADRPSYIDTTAPGSYFYKVTAEDAAGNIGAASNEAAATVTADTTAPTIPAGLAAAVTGATANLSWSASTDDVAVIRYNLHRSTSAGFTPSPANRIAQPTGTSYADSGLSTGSYYYKLTAEDAAGNISAASNEATATIADATPPSAPGTLTATATAQHDQPQLGRRHRQRRRQPLQPPPRHHAAASPPAPPTGSRNRPAPATPTPASPPAPTSTRGAFASATGGGDRHAFCDFGVLSRAQRALSATSHAEIAYGAARSYRVPRGSRIHSSPSPASRRPARSARA